MNVKCRSATSAISVHSFLCDCVSVKILVCVYMNLKVCVVCVCVCMFDYKVFVCCVTLFHSLSLQNIYLNTCAPLLFLHVLSAILC